MGNIYVIRRHVLRLYARCRVLRWCSTGRFLTQYCCAKNRYVYHDDHLLQRCKNLKPVQSCAILCTTTNVALKIIAKNRPMYNITIRYAVRHLPFVDIYCLALFYRLLNYKWHCLCIDKTNYPLHWFGIRLLFVNSTDVWSRFDLGST